MSEGDPIRAARPEPTALMIKWADMASRSRLEAAVRPWRLSSGQMLVLATIERLGTASAADLARALHLTPQAMTTLLKPLEQRGIVDRQEDVTNRRRLALSLSPSGTALLAEIRPTTELVDRDIVAGLDPDELKQFRALLAKIAAPPRP